MWSRAVPPFAMAVWTVARPTFRGSGAVVATFILFVVRASCPEAPRGDDELTILLVDDDQSVFPVHVRRIVQTRGVDGDAARSGDVAQCVEHLGALLCRLGVGGR